MTPNTEVNRRIKVPRDKTEEHQLKDGLTEDDNEDIAYLNFRIVWPLSILSGISVVFLLLTVVSMEWMEHYTTYRLAENQLWLQYGKSTHLCRDNVPKLPEYWPSIFRQIELKVLSNIFYRVAVCIPMAVRIFTVMITRNAMRAEVEKKGLFTGIFRITNEGCVYLAIIEVVSQALFAIITIRFDFPAMYHFCFTTFVLSSSIYMIMRTILLWSVSEPSSVVDIVSILIKLFCTVLYSWTVPQFYNSHLAFIETPTCHGYVPQLQALNEYVAMGSYLLFHLSQLIDIRDIRFICYPRTCSGECEPLQPDNFKQGGKYEFCRSYELRQHQLLELAS